MSARWPSSTTAWSAAVSTTLVARHYGDTLIGAGGNHGLGGAVWNGDLVVTFTDEDTVPSLVTNLTYSWMWGGKNVSGVVEYFYNGFGQADGCYTAECLEDNPELLSRLARGELFTLGRNYLAVSAMFELHPLFLLTPNVFVNIGDPSAFLQVVFQIDLKQNLVLRRSADRDSRPLPLHRPQHLRTARVVLVIHRIYDL